MSKVVLGCSIVQEVVARLSVLRSCGFLGDWGRQTGNLPAWERAGSAAFLLSYLFLKAAFCSCFLWFITWSSHPLFHQDMYSFLTILLKLILVCYHCHAWKTICIWYFLVNFIHPVPCDFYFYRVLQKRCILNSTGIAHSTLLFPLS